MNFGHKVADMQQERGALDSFPETIDLNQGSLVNDTSMDHLASWDNMMNPVENRLSNYMLSSTDRSVSCANAANDCSLSSSGWDHGESSSGTGNMQDGACGDDSKHRLGWSSSFNACSVSDSRSEDWSFEPSNISSASYVGNQRSCRTLSMHNYSSNHGSPAVSSNHGHLREHDCQSGLGAGLPHRLCNSDHSDMEMNPTFYASSSNIGMYSGISSTFSENNDASGPSFSHWGSSCKREALEGTSGQCFPGGSSSSSWPLEKSIMQHPVPGLQTGPGNLSISSSTLDFASTNHLEQVYPSSGVGMSRIATRSLPSPSVPGIAESSPKTLSVRSNHGRHESVPFDTARGTSLRHSGVNAAHLAESIANTKSDELGSSMTLLINQNNPSLPHLMHVNGARGMHAYPRDGSFSSQSGSLTGSFVVSLERNSGARPELDARNPCRNNLECTTVSVLDTRNTLQDHIDWSFAPVTSASSRNQSSGSQIGLSSGGQASSAACLFPQNQASQNHQRSSESAPWIPFPEVEPGSLRSFFVLLPSASSSSSNEAASSSCAQHQFRQSSAGFLMDTLGVDINGWHALAAVEGRHRQIRQALNAVWRGIHLQAEDYMVFDPFIKGIAELHDRHTDMRLDVDNMSYEELLALEEQIGNVNTGLSEEKIMGSMRQRKYEATAALPNLEPCCICQEDYFTGDDIGMLDCGHEFHTSCIKQWLTLKNLCPICKMTALENSPLGPCLVGERQLFPWKTFTEPLPYASSPRDNSFCL